MCLCPSLRSAGENDCSNCGEKRSKDGYACVRCYDNTTYWMRRQHGGVSLGILRRERDLSSSRSWLLYRRFYWPAVFWRLRDKVIAFVCISSKISLINFKCVYNRSHLSCPQSYRYIQRWNATEAFRFSATGWGESSPKLRHKIATGYEPVESGCLPCIPVVLPACLVQKLRPRLATELSKLVFSLWRSERQKSEFRNRLWSGTGVCVFLTAVITAS